MLVEPVGDGFGLLGPTKHRKLLLAVGNRGFEADDLLRFVRGSAFTAGAGSGTASSAGSSTAARPSFWRT
jgi:hypothetical protein